MKALSVRMIILALIILALIMLKPDWVQKAPYGSQIVNYRNQIIASQPQINGIVQTVNSVDWNGVWATIKEQKLPVNPLNGQPKEVKVEDLASQLTGQLKNLPQEKAKAVKANFCQDVVAEALKQGQVAGATTSK